MTQEQPKWEKQTLLNLFMKPKPKPEALRSNSKTKMSTNYLQDNLLGDDIDDAPKLPPKELPIRITQPTRRKLDDGSSRLIIAIDYGTTFTGVAWAVTSSETAILDEVQIITDWGAGMSNVGKVPSVISYTMNNEQQWGANISGNSIAMVNTKMELDVQGNKVDELELILQMLEGTMDLHFDAVRNGTGYPTHAFKSPEEIVTDYLTQIFSYVNQFFDERIKTEAFGTNLKEKIPVDIVVTVPVNWSYRAMNATFRAISSAGFNNTTFKNLKDTILVTEPEAAALYTARHLKEDRQTSFLRLGECFILCDAGGGTVDCVSYKVTQLEPLTLEKVSTATSAKCGSSFIDTEFKNWLVKAIGEQHYSVLDPRTAGRRSQSSEGPLMRSLMKQFDLKKRAFTYSGSDENVIIDMPEHHFDNVHVPQVLQDGELFIACDEMAGFFDHSINGVIELVKGQLAEVQGAGNRVKNVFLVGGFAESPFLQEELVESLEQRNINLRKPDKFKAWTAVVQGAVMYGIEKAHHKKKLTTMSTCIRSYGIATDERFSSVNNEKRDFYVDPLTDRKYARMQIEWFIRRGDLILSDSSKTWARNIECHFTEAEHRVIHLPIYCYTDEEDDVPTTLSIGENELVVAGILICDLSKLPAPNFERLQNPATRQIFYSIHLKFAMSLSMEGLKVGLYLKDKKLCSTLIKDVEGSAATPPIHPATKKDENNPWRIQEHDNRLDAEMPGRSEFDES